MFLEADRVTVGKKAPHETAVVLVLNVENGFLFDQEDRGGGCSLMREVVETEKDVP